jgi:hypothetical protein
MTIPAVSNLRNFLQQRGYREPSQCDSGEIFLHREHLAIELVDMGPLGKESLWQLKDSTDGDHQLSPHTVVLPVQDPEKVTALFKLFGISLTHKGFTLKFVEGPETDFHIGFHVPMATDITKVKLRIIETQLPEFEQLGANLAKNKTGSESGKTHAGFMGCGIEVTYGPSGMRGHNMSQQPTVPRPPSESPYTGIGGTRLTRRLW